MKKYDAVEFIEELKQGRLKPVLKITGMAKPSNDETAILVDLHMNCKQWLEVPVSMIEKDGIVWSNEVTCGDHTHPLVTIELKWPETQEGAVLASAISAMQQQRGIATFSDAMAAPHPSSETIEHLLTLNYRRSADYFSMTRGENVVARQIHTTCTNCISNRSSPFFGYVYCCEWKRNPDRPFEIELIRCWKVSNCIAHDQPGDAPDEIVFR